MKNLFTPISLRNLTLKNRIVVSPMQQYSSPDGKATNWHLVHLGSRAVGGAGLIITESTAVLPEGRSTTVDAGIWNDEQAESWKPIIDFVHQQDSKIAMQLGHFGSKGSRAHPKDGFGYLNTESGGWQTVSSSAKAPFRGMSVPKEVSKEEIEFIKNAFVEAAQKAIRVGFDSLEIHAAHGYLFHQFYSALINERTDEYGGSFENRIRFLVETIQAVRKIMPKEMPLLVRISAVDYVEDKNAWQIEDSVKLSSILKQEGVDMITASAGGFVFLSPDKVFPNYQLPFATQIKQETEILTGTVGMITDAKQANQIIQNEEADLIVIAREFLRNPYFALQAANELEIENSVPWQYQRAF